MDSDVLQLAIPNFQHIFNPPKMWHCKEKNCDWYNNDMRDNCEKCKSGRWKPLSPKKARHLKWGNKNKFLLYDLLKSDLGFCKISQHVADGHNCSQPLYHMYCFNQIPRILAIFFKRFTDHDLRRKNEDKIKIPEILGMFWTIQRY